MSKPRPSGPTPVVPPVGPPPPPPNVPPPYPPTQRQRSNYRMGTGNIARSISLSGGTPEPSNDQRTQRVRGSRNMGVGHIDRSAD